MSDTTERPMTLQELFEGKEEEHIRRADRVQLAGMAMMGLLADPNINPDDKWLVTKCCHLADALLAELDRTETK